MQPKIIEHERKMQTYSELTAEIQLTDGGQSYLSELPIEPDLQL